MNNKMLVGLGIVFVLSVAVSSLIMISCGSGGGGGSSTTDYTIQGTVAGVSVSGLKASAANTVTDIVAIGANNEKYKAALNSDGTFSIGIIKGWPYVLGFFNKSSGTITLLGYLQQTDVDWDSLPVMDPSGDSTNLGSVTIEAASFEATPSIDLTSLIADMNMDLTTAQYYGTIDNPLAVLTNLDLDNNGEFDFDEDKAYLFQTYINMGPGIGYVSGEVDKMLAGYNETYAPKPSGYQFNFAAQGDTKTAGTSATLTCPENVSNQDGTTSLTATGSIVADSSGTGWNCFFSVGSSSISSPEVAPSGTYEVSVDSTTYTIKNFKASEVVKVNSTDGIIYPVFHLVTNEAGYVTTVQYKWKKLVNGVITTAEAAEIKASIEDTSLDTTFVHTSPFISFFSDANTLIGSIIKFERDGSSLDVSSLNIKTSDIHHIQASENLTSRVVCKFDFQ